MTQDKEGGPDPAMVRLLKELIPAIGGLFVLVLGAYVLWFAPEKVSNDPGDWAALGDYFGGLMNPVISFATLLVAYAVWKLQRVELEETKKALEEQAKTAEQQRQEQRFFDLFNVYNRVLDSYTAPSDLGRERKGKEAVASAMHDLPGYLKYTLRHGFGQILEQQTLTPDYVADRWARDRELKQFTTYLRVVFRLLDEAEPQLGDQHLRYITIFQAQLSDAELQLIGLLAWVDPQWKSEQRLLQKYCLLKHFPDGPFKRALAVQMLPNIFYEKAAPC